MKRWGIKLDGLYWTGQPNGVTENPKAARAWEDEFDAFVQIDADPWLRRYRGEIEIVELNAPSKEKA